MQEKIRQFKKFVSPEGAEPAQDRPNQAGPQQGNPPTPPPTPAPTTRPRSPQRAPDRAQV